jgi:hypothetical protein
MKQLLELYSNFESTEVLLALCGLFMVFGIGSLVLVFISRNSKKASKIRIGKIEAQSQVFISELIFEEELSKEGLRLKRLLFYNSFRRNILLGEIIKLHANLQGELALKLEEYYVQSKLCSETVKKINSKKKDVILKGLSEYLEMNFRSGLRSIYLLFNKTKDPELNNELVVAIIKLDVKYGIELLLNLKTYLSDWYQLKIIKILDELMYTSHPPLEKWIEKGGSLAIFGCRLVAFSKSHQEIPVLVELLSCKNDALKIEAIRTLGILEAESVNDTLIGIYFGESDPVKEEILKTLKIFRKTNNIPFFLKCIKTTNKEEKLMALQAIDFIMQSNGEHLEISKLEELLLTEERIN